MSSIDIFRTAADLLDHDERLVMATIMSASGSTPAGVSSKMLVRSGGAEPIGTIGGGCMEAEIIRKARGVLESGIPEICSYTLTEDDVDHGLICGGTLHVLLDCIDRTQQTFFRDIAGGRAQGRDGALVTTLAPQSASGHWFIREDGAASGVLPAQADREGILQAIAELGTDRKSRTKTIECGVPCFIEHIPGFPHLFIFGGGHVSRFIARFAKTAGFMVTVVDDRIKFANAQRFPDADETVVGPWESVVNTLTLHRNSYVVIVTRGHNYDEWVLEQVLLKEPRHIGMIGSRRKITITYKHLMERGIPEERLRQVAAPMGLDIGSETPEEIGIAVVAELIKVRRTGGYEPAPHMRDRLNKK